MSEHVSGWDAWTAAGVTLSSWNAEAEWSVFEVAFPGPARMNHEKKLGLTLAGIVGITATLLSAALGVQVLPTHDDDAADAAMPGIRPERIRAGMRFLEDDLLEGRGTGGYEIAARFEASNAPNWVAVALGGGQVYLVRRAGGS